MEAAKEDWAVMCPSSRRFLTGEGENRPEAVQRRMNAEVAEQCDAAAKRFFDRMHSDFMNYVGTWHSFPKAFNCLLDAELAPHFAFQVDCT